MFCPIWSESIFIGTNLKLKWPPERKAVTIVAGFKSRDGVVLCADTQETIAGFSKRQVPKLVSLPLYDSEAEEPNLAAVFCGATDNGPFLDELIHETWDAVQQAKSFAEACRTAKEAIQEHYRKFGAIYQVGCCPTAELLYGIKMDGQSSLFSALGPSVNENDGYATGGIGCHLANFLIDRMGYESDWMTLRQCLIIAAYVLFQTKQYVDGCGGETQIAILQISGPSGKVNHCLVDWITSLVCAADEQLGHALLTSADLSIDHVKFRENMESIVEVLAIAREYEREKIDKFRKFWMSDALGVMFRPFRKA
jgi:20S proteasome alpha/beta subunit